MQIANGANRVGIENINITAAAAHRHQRREGVDRVHIIQLRDNHGNILGRMNVCNRHPRQNELVIFPVARVRHSQNNTRHGGIRRGVELARSLIAGVLQNAVCVAVVYRVGVSIWRNAARGAQSQRQSRKPGAQQRARCHRQRRGGEVGNAQRQHEVDIKRRRRRYGSVVGQIITDDGNRHQCRDAGINRKIVRAQHCGETGGNSDNARGEIAGAAAWRYRADGDGHARCVRAFCLHFVQRHNRRGEGDFKRRRRRFGGVVAAVVADDRQSRHAGDAGKRRKYVFAYHRRKTGARRDNRRRDIARAAAWRYCADDDRHAGVKRFFRLRFVQRNVRRQDIMNRYQRHRRRHGRHR